MPACVYWITGLSGSGKSTIASLLRQQLVVAGLHPILLDGDTIRELLLEPLGYDRSSRLSIARFYSKMCRFLAIQGKTIICPTISLFHDIQSWNRDNIPGYFEIFLDAPLDVVRTRDPKGIYRKFDQGTISDVVGMDISPEYPLNPDISLQITNRHTTEDILHAILEKIETSYEN